MERTAKKNKNKPKDVILEVHDLTVRFGELTVLESISFNINRGSFTGLIGPNGAGKSTLLKVLLGLITPSSGSFTVHENITMRYVPQQYALPSFVPVSVAEVVQMGSNVHVPVQAVTDVLAQVGLDVSFATKNYHTLSGGQKQRVMIARALIVIPDVIFFDEPLSGVDLETKAHIHTFLKELNEKGTTIFFVSHDIDHIVDACDLVLCLDRSLHRGCHPVAFARGDRDKELDLHADTTCLVDHKGSHTKKAVHHHHT